MCLLLALAPLTGAASWPPSDSNDDDPPASQMPCHGAGGPSSHAGTAPAQADCPNCVGEAAPTSCHCCGQSGQAGIDSRLGALTAEYVGLALAGAAPLDPLPDSPTARLFRPPIPSR
jgi:hypothetical protein